MPRTNEKTIKRVKDRFGHWLGLAEARHFAEGIAWYRDAHEFAVQLARVYGIPLVKTTGVIAALSPSVRWDINKRQAEDLCRAYADGGDLENVIVSTYGGQAEKARVILWSGTTSMNVAAMLGRRAFKTRAFYHNILCTEGTDVTVDQHIIAAAGFEDDWVQSARWCYDLLADAICELAEDWGLLACEIQAVIWVTYKDITSRVPEDEIPF